MVWADVGELAVEGGRKEEFQEESENKISKGIGTEEVMEHLKEYVHLRQSIRIC